MQTDILLLSQVFERCHFVMRSAREMCVAYTWKITKVV